MPPPIELYAPGLIGPLNKGVLIGAEIVALNGPLTMGVSDGFAWPNLSQTP